MSKDERKSFSKASFADNAKRSGSAKSNDELIYSDDFNSMKLNRKVSIKCYAPETFKRMRKLSNFSEEDLISSLDPAKNIKEI